MHLKRVVAAILFASLMLFSSTLPSTCAKGARTGDLVMYPYIGPAICYDCLVNDEIDIMAWPLTQYQYNNAKYNPNIVVAPYEGNDMTGLTFNLNRCIADYQGVQSPMTYLEFRQAIAYVVNKDWIVDTVLGGWGIARIDVPVPYSQKYFWNTSVTGDNYPYELSEANAKSVLDDKFPEGSTPNPYYDGQLYSAQYIRTYPIGHDLAGTDLHQIVFCSWNDYVWRSIAEDVRDHMRRLGIPVNLILGEAADWNFYSRVMDNMDFHIFTGSQFTWRYPVTFAWNAFTLMRAFGSPSPKILWDGRTDTQKLQEGLGGLQSVKIHKYVTEAKNSWISSSFGESLAHSMQAQGSYVETALGIPLWSTKGYFAYRKELLGVVNMRGYGILNKYTLLNAYREPYESDNPIRIGLVGNPFQMNIMHAEMPNDYFILDTIFEDMMSSSPYSDSDQPWIVQDWNTGTWINPETEEPCTVVDYWFREDVYAAEPVSGLQYDAAGEPDPFDAYDYEFTCYFLSAQGYRFDPCIPHWGRFKDIYNVTIIDPCHVKVYMNITSYWAPYAPTYPVIPKGVWLREPLAHFVEGPWFQTGEDGFSLPGPVPLSERVVSGSCDTKVIVKLTNGHLYYLDWGTDFTWTMGNLTIKVDSLYGMPITAVWPEYWTYGSTEGYYPGDLDWTEILIGYGPYYVHEIYQAPDYVVLKRNPYFFMETPLLGEIDWSWKWVAGPKPRSGYYKVDIFDLSLACGAFGGQGIYVPSPNWFPAADLASPGGVIDIFDLVTVSGSNWDGEFGRPPG